LSTDFDSSGKHSNALTVVIVIFFLVRTACTNTIFGSGIPVDYTLTKLQNLAFPVRNYISSILITSFTLDIKLQKRWFPAQDFSVRIT